MNQILDTGDYKKRKPLHIKSIIKFFAISLLIFAICIIGVAVYSIFNNSEGQVNQKPEIQITKDIEDKKINIKITDDIGIKDITYILNNEEINLEANGALQKDILLELTNGENSFKIIVTDINGEQKEYEELYSVETGVSIQFEQQGNKVNVNIISESNIAYVTYRWDEQEENKEEVNEEEYSFEVETPEEDGKYILTVNIVDENNNTVEETKEVIKDTEPTIEVTRTYQEFVIVARDDEELIKAELTLNGERLEDIEIDEATWEYKVPYVEENGENKLIIKVYNINGIPKQRKVMVDTSRLPKD